MTLLKICGHPGRTANKYIDSSLATLAQDDTAKGSEARASAAAFAEGHVGGGASGGFLPLQKKFAVGFGDVVARIDAERAGGAVDPARRALDLGDNPYGRVVDDNLALAIAPFGAEFFVDKARDIAQRAQNGVELWAVLDGGLVLLASFVFSRRALCLMGEPPALSILAQTQNGTLTAQGIARPVVK